MRRERIGKNILTVLFVLISIAYMMPIVVVLFNSFKIGRASCRERV